jgi:hypothetical protein
MHEGHIACFILTFLTVCFYPKWPAKEHVVLLATGRSGNALPFGRALVGIRTVTEKRIRNIFLVTSATSSITGPRHRADAVARLVPITDGTCA